MATTNSQTPNQQATDQSGGTVQQRIAKQYVAIVIEVAPGNVKRQDEVFESTIFPLAQGMQGFKGSMQLLKPQNGYALWITYWDNDQHAGAFKRQITGQLEGQDLSELPVVSYQVSSQVELYS